MIKIYSANNKGFTSKYGDDDYDYDDDGGGDDDDDDDDDDDEDDDDDVLNDCAGDGLFNG